MKKIAIILCLSVSVSIACTQKTDNPDKARTGNFLATYFGGSANESSWGIALDEAGNVYVSGLTLSPDFPVAPNATFNTAKGKGDAYILKFDKDLKTLLASARIGGSEDDCAYTILYDKRGSIYVAGYTNSTDFPTTSSAYCKKYGGGEGDAFILKLDTDLKTLEASTYFGGSGDENDWRSPAIILDKQGNLIIGGSTGSPDFPTTAGAYCEKYNGGVKDLFLSKFDSGLTRLIASTLLGGSESDELGRGLGLDPESKSIYLGGYTFSKNFPTSEKSWSRNVSGNLDGFVARFSEDLSRLEASTILDKGWIYSLLVHTSGNVYVGGHGSGVPTTPGAFCQGTELNLDMGFISCFSSDLSTLKSSTILPGTGTPNMGGESISLNLSQCRDGNIMSAGWASQGDIPITHGAFDETPNGGNDTYLLKMTPDLSRLLAATVVGGSKNERWNRLADDGKGFFYLGSYTLSTNFPTTPGVAFGKFNGGGNDGFVIRIADDLMASNIDPFHEAAETDNLQKIKQLLSANSGLLDQPDQYKRTALHSAARYGALQTADFLIGKGANVNASDENGNTPLHLAVMFRHDEIATLLINHGADVNRQNKDQSSPLLLATMYGTSQATEILLIQKADINLKDAQGNTPLHLSSSYKQLEKTELLLKYDPVVDMRNLAGNTPLHLAVVNRDSEKIIAVLLNNGANIAAADSTGKNALLMATSSERGTAEMLLKKGADIRSQDSDGNTVLHYPLQIVLMSRPYLPIIMDKLKMYMEYGADPDIKNKQGKSAMDMANEIGDKALIELFSAKSRK